MDSMDHAAVAEALEDLRGWRHEDDELHREFDLGDYRAAIDFIVRIADAAEAADHHPELINTFDRVAVALTTHDAGGVTEKDLALARAIDAIAQEQR